MMNFVKKNKYVLVAAAILLAGSYGGYKYYQSTQVSTAAVKMGEVKKRQYCRNCFGNRRLERTG